jgi:hypothetical protein
MWWCHILESGCSEGVISVAFGMVDKIEGFCERQQYLRIIQQRSPKKTQIFFITQHNYLFKMFVIRTHWTLLRRTPVGRLTKE